MPRGLIYPDLPCPSPALHPALFGPRNEKTYAYGMCCALTVAGLWQVGGREEGAGWREEGA